MIEARVFLSSIDEVNNIRKKLENFNAVFKGEYCLTDKIYSSYNPKKELDDEFLRLRIYHKNIWPQKDVILSVKIHDQKEIGVDAAAPLKKEFDTEEDANKYIEDNLLDKYKYEFTFTRTGWQYDLNEDQVDIEKVDDLENFYTIEFKSQTIQGLRNIENLLNLKDIILGPIASHMKSLILK